MKSGLGPAEIATRYGFWHTLTALVSIAQHEGEFTVALRHARELAALDPENAQLRALVTGLEQKARQ